MERHMCQSGIQLLSLEMILLRSHDWRSKMQLAGTTCLAFLVWEPVWVSLFVMNVIFVL